jgi:hypothetical protein
LEPTRAPHDVIVVKWENEPQPYFKEVIDALSIQSSQWLRLKHAQFEAIGYLYLPDEGMRGLDMLLLYPTWSNVMWQSFSGKFPYSIYIYNYDDGLITYDIALLRQWKEEMGLTSKIKPGEVFYLTRSNVWLPLSNLFTASMWAKTTRTKFKLKTWQVALKHIPKSTHVYAWPENIWLEYANLLNTCLCLIGKNEAALEHARKACDYYIEHRKTLWQTHEKSHGYVDVIQEAQLPSTAVMSEEPLSKSTDEHSAMVLDIYRYLLAAFFIWS